MSFSKLVKGVTLSPNKSSRLDTMIDSVAIHTMASNSTAEGCGSWFGLSTTQASSNYGIDSDGVIWGYVDESDRSWCTSNGGVDRRAITIEVASLTSEEPFQCSEKAYNSLISLLVDICRRYSITLRWENDKQYAIDASNGGPVDKQNMFVHRWFNTVKSCPGQYLFDRQSQIASDVNSQLSSSSRSSRLSIGSGIAVSYVSNTSSAQPTTYSSSTASSASTYEVSRDTEISDKRIIFIGDSRISNMAIHIGSNNYIWSYSKLASYSWFTKKSALFVDTQIQPETYVCISLGVSDILTIDYSEYCRFINECADRWTQSGAFVYFISLNPVGTLYNASYNGITNEYIAQYNQNIRNNLNSNVGYIDTYSALLNNYETTDGYNFDKSTSLAFYHLILGALSSDDTMYSDSAVIGGVPIQVDYTTLNPYIVTLDRHTSDSFGYQDLKSSGVVGAIIEGGYLYDEYHTKVVKFRQPKLESQLKAIQAYNLPYGFFFTIRSRNLSEARSEMQEIYYFLRANSCKLGVWLKLSLASVQIPTNDKIIEYFQKELVRLGFKFKIGFYIPKSELNNFTWSKYSSDWLLWIIDHVDNTSEIQKLLDSSFFDVGGV